jgi:mannonate dehydratase
MKIGSLERLAPKPGPTMAGEANHQPGYGSKGNLFSIGYLKGIMHALNIDHE